MTARGGLRGYESGEGDNKKRSKTRPSRCVVRCGRRRGTTKVAKSWEGEAHDVARERETEHSKSERRARRACQRSTRRAGRLKGVGAPSRRPLAVVSSSCTSGKEGTGTGAPRCGVPRRKSCGVCSCSPQCSRYRGEANSHERTSARADGEAKARAGHRPRLNSTAAVCVFAKRRKIRRRGRSSEALCQLMIVCVCVMLPPLTRARDGRCARLGERGERRGESEPWLSLRE